MTSAERAAAKERVLDTLLVRLDEVGPRLALEQTYDEQIVAGAVPEITRGLEYWRELEPDDRALRSLIRGVRAWL